MKHWMALFLGFTAATALSCQAHQHALGSRAEVVVIDLTGLR